MVRGINRVAIAFWVEAARFGIEMRVGKAQLAADMPAPYSGNHSMSDRLNSLIPLDKTCT
jgi:hypothetical protein